MKVVAENENVVFRTLSGGLGICQNDKFFQSSIVFFLKVSKKNSFGNVHSFIQKLHGIRSYFEERNLWIHTLTNSSEKMLPENVFGISNYLNLIFGENQIDMQSFLSAPEKEVQSVVRTLEKENIPGKRIGDLTHIETLYFDRSREVYRSSDRKSLVDRFSRNNSVLNLANSVKDFSGKQSSNIRPEIDRNLDTRSKVSILQFPEAVRKEGVSFSGEREFSRIKESFVNQTIFDKESIGIQGWLLKQSPGHHPAEKRVTVTGAIKNFSRHFSNNKVLSYIFRSNHFNEVSNTLGTIRGVNLTPKHSSVNPLERFGKKNVVVENTFTSIPKNEVILQRNAGEGIGSVKVFERMHGKEGINLPHSPEKKGLMQVVNNINKYKESKNLYYKNQSIVKGLNERVVEKQTQFDVSKLLPLMPAGSKGELGLNLSRKSLLSGKWMNITGGIQKVNQADFLSKNQSDHFSISSVAPSNTEIIQHLQTPMRLDYTSGTVSEKSSPFALPAIKINHSILPVANQKPSEISIDIKNLVGTVQFPAEKSMKGNIEDLSKQMSMAFHRELKKVLGR